MRTPTGQGIPNIEAATTEYPFGKFRDKTSALTNDGTELSERTMGDTYQGMLNTIIGAGMTPNNEPERKGDSQFQKAVELLKPVGVAVVGSDDGTTFKVLSSIIRDPAITLTAGFGALTENAPFLFANFQIKRNGTVDTSRRYIVKASPTYDFSSATVLSLAVPPNVLVSCNPYFNNMSLYFGGISNLTFVYPQSISPADALANARAVLTIYDAGAAS